MNKNLEVKNKIYLVAMLIVYGIAVVTCFIVDYILTDSFTWSMIVLVSVMISFSITNLPFLLKKHRSVITGIVVTALIYLLLYVCCNFAGGNWLLSFAYPIATISLAFAWIIFIVLKYCKINYGYKAAIILLLSGIVTITSNPFIAYLGGEEYSIKDSFVYDGGAVNNEANGIMFVGLIIVAIISTIAGIVISIRGKKK